MKLFGTTALILGATRGIGRAIALSLAHSGVRLILPYYDWPKSCEETFAALQKTGTNHLFIKTDLRDTAAVAHLFDQIQAQTSELTILVNNIERGGMPIVHGPYTDEQWYREIDTTLKAKWLVFQNALPLLKRADEAAVVTLSSIAAEVGRSGPAGLIFNDAYAAANQAVSSFTRTWARQGAPTVRVNELVLGLIEQRHGPDTRGWQLLSHEDRTALEKRALLQRTGRIEEVVRAVHFLIEGATFMTGSRIVLDGGYRLGHDNVPPLPQGEDDVAIQRSGEKKP